MDGITLKLEMVCTKEREQGTLQGHLLQERCQDYQVLQVKRIHLLRIRHRQQQQWNGDRSGSRC